jgi:hypothetical protein
MCDTCKATGRVEATLFESLQELYREIELAHASADTACARGVENLQWGMSVRIRRLLARRAPETGQKDARRPSLD